MSTKVAIQLHRSLQATTRRCVCVLLRAYVQRVVRSVASAPALRFALVASLPDTPTAPVLVNVSRL